MHESVKPDGYGGSIDDGFYKLSHTYSQYVKKHMKDIASTISDVIEVLKP